MLLIFKSPWNARKCSIGQRLLLAWGEQWEGHRMAQAIPQGESVTQAVSNLTLSCTVLGGEGQEPQACPQVTGQAWVDPRTRRDWPQEAPWCLCVCSQHIR